MQLHIERPLSVRDVLVPKSYPIDLVSYTVDKWSTTQSAFLFLKKILPFLGIKLHFFCMFYWIIILKIRISKIRLLIA